MSESVWVDVWFWAFSLAAVLAGWRVFKTGSMVRASFFLLASLLSGGAIMLLLGAEYLGFALFFMMAVEMTVMALFMVAFMMNPAGLNPMSMVHQKRVAIVAGWVVFLALAGVGVFARFPDRPVTTLATSIEDLGVELLGDSMLVFESAGVALLATMIGAIALASRRGRYGSGEEGSSPPRLDPEAGAEERPRPMPARHHEGHGGHQGHAGHGGHAEHGGPGDPGGHSDHGDRSGHGDHR